MNLLLSISASNTSSVLTKPRKSFTLGEKLLGPTLVSQSVSTGCFFFNQMFKRTYDTVHLINATDYTNQYNQMHESGARALTGDRTPRTPHGQLPPGNTVIRISCEINRMIQIACTYVLSLNRSCQLLKMRANSRSFLKKGVLPPLATDPLRARWTPSVGSEWETDEPLSTPQVNSSAQVHGLLLQGLGIFSGRGGLGPWCAQTLAGFTTRH